MSPLISRLQQQIDMIHVKLRTALKTKAPWTQGVN